MKPKVKKIQPFFRSLTPKMRVMIYLLGSGEFSFDQLRKLKVSEFCELKLIEKIPVSLDLMDACYELKNQPEEGMVFVGNTGRKYSVLDIIKILKRAHRIADHEYNGLEEFVKYVTA